MRAPPLFAVRSYGHGRVALLNSWRQYTLGSGDKWLFGSQVLSEGADGRPSDLGQLLANTFGWLATSTSSVSSAQGRPGGYMQPPQRLDSPNAAASVRAVYADTNYSYMPALLSGVNPAPGIALGVRGLIGLKSNYSRRGGGRGSSVAELAAAANALPAQHAVGFLVFLDDFAAADGSTLTPEMLEALRVECVVHSTSKVHLIPGYTITTNLGNKMMFLGPTVPYPPRSPKDALTPDGKRLMIQPFDPAHPGNFTGVGADIVGNWLLSAMDSAIVPGKGWNVGYFHLGPSRPPGALGLTNLVDSSLAGTTYFNSSGGLVEDLTDDFLATAAGGITPIPVVVSEIETLAGLQSAAVTAVTVVRTAKTGVEAFAKGLRWNNQYDAMPVYTTAGGISIDAWEDTVRHMVLGAAPFVVGSPFQSPGKHAVEAALSVSSPSGLRSVSIYNGDRLFRRFELNGVRHCFKRLMLETYLHRNLVLVAEDMEGNRALSFPRRNWKSGVRAVEYCGDHYNDCQSEGFLAARGPYSPTNTFQTPLPLGVAGMTWDGGPAALAPLLVFTEARPALDSSAGSENTATFTQTPTLEHADEEVVAVTAKFGQRFSDRLDRAINPWVSFGPLAGPGRLLNASLRYREYYPAVMGVRETGVPWFNNGAGSIATLFRHEITFARAQTVNQLWLLSTSGAPPPSLATTVLLVGTNRSAPPRRFNVSALDTAVELTVAVGGWWGLWSPAVSNAQIFVNERTALRVRLIAPRHSPAWFTVSAALDPGGYAVRAGERFVSEFAQFGVSLLTQLPDVESLVRLHEYLRTPPVQVLRGPPLACSVVCHIQLNASSGLVTELMAPLYAGDPQMMLPLRFGGLNPRWSAGLWQKSGYGGGTGVESEYGNGTDRYTALGVDDMRFAYAPLYIGQAAAHVVAGHPVVAQGQGGDELFIEVTHVNAVPSVWHVAVNNPTAAPVHVRLRAMMQPSGFGMAARDVTLSPGEHLVVM